jgi:hypothetical protein
VPADSADLISNIRHTGTNWRIRSAASHVPATRALTAVLVSSGPESGEPTQRFVLSAIGAEPFRASSSYIPLAWRVNEMTLAWQMNEKTAALTGPGHGSEGRPGHGSEGRPGHGPEGRQRTTGVNRPRRHPSRHASRDARGRRRRSSSKRHRRNPPASYHRSRRSGEG